MAHDREKTVRKILEAFAFGADVKAACAYAEISRDTYYRWCQEDPTLAEKSDIFREKPILKAYRTIARHMDQVDTARWYLERKKRKEFAQRQEVDDVSENKGQLVYKVMMGDEYEEGTDNKQENESTNNKCGDIQTTPKPEEDKTEPSTVEGDSVRSEVRENNDGDSGVAVSCTEHTQ